MYGLCVYMVSKASRVIDGPLQVWLTTGAET